MRLTGGEWGGQIVISSPGPKTRPTSDANRESLFNVLTHGFGHEMQVVLDLFAGTGALSLEALSRGARQSILIESDPKAIGAIEKNFEKIVRDSDRSWQLIKEHDFRRWAALLKKAKLPPIDTIFCDPPYGKDLVSRAFKSFILVPELFTPGALWIAETSTDEDLPKTKEWEVVEERSRGTTRLLFYKRIC